MTHFHKNPSQIQLVLRDPRHRFANGQKLRGSAANKPRSPPSLSPLSRAARPHRRRPRAAAPLRCSSIKSSHTASSAAVCYPSSPKLVSWDAANTLQSSPPLRCSGRRVHALQAMFRWPRCGGAAACGHGPSTRVCDARARVPEHVAASLPSSSPDRPREALPLLTSRRRWGGPGLQPSSSWAGLLFFFPFFSFCFPIFFKTF